MYMYSARTKREEETGGEGEREIKLPNCKLSVGLSLDAYLSASIREGKKWKMNAFLSIIVIDTH